MPDINPDREYGYLKDGRPITRKMLEEVAARYGETGESPIVKITKEPDDPLGVLRASIGGTDEVGHYLIFRGDMLKVQEMIRKVLQAFEEMNDVP